MDGLVCDRCGRALLVGEEARYICEARVYAAYDPLELTEQDLAESTRPGAMEALIAACEAKSAQELEDEIHRAFRFDLCMRCQKAYLAAPLPPLPGAAAPRSLARRVGVLGGSFDPIHLGHLHIAREAAERLALDRVLLVPAAEQPLKVGRAAASGEARLAMVRAVCRGRGGWLEACTVELERGGTSYTVDTLAELRTLLGPEAELFFLGGADVAETLPLWREPERVASLARVVLLTRPGYVVRVPASLEGRVHLLETEGVALSSTEVRRRVAEGAPLSGLVPDEVAEIIAARGLYRAA